MNKNEQEMKRIVQAIAGLDRLLPTCTEWNNALRALAGFLEIAVKIDATANAIDPERDPEQGLAEWMETYIARMKLKLHDAYPFEALQNHLRSEIERAGLAENFPPGSDLGKLVWEYAEANQFFWFLVMKNPQLEPVIEEARKFARAWREEIERES